MADTVHASSPLDVFGGQQWERALFGTFTLSLAFFDSYVSWLLREQDCEQIDVLVDVRGYRSSLQERGALGPGQEYELVPVNVPKGIFHPKFAYLWGWDGADDVLLIGSGNLTFGGYGRNVEVFDVLEESKAPQAFDDFADFLIALVDRPGVHVANRKPVHSTLDRVAQRSSRRARLPANDRVRLIHSVQVPILDQFMSAASACTPVTELIVWSPYHHPKAEPVARLAAALKPERILIGCPLDKQSTTTFPPVASIAGVPVHAIRPDVADSQKVLHAKWWEVRGARNLVLTGSANATLESICETTNVELAVMREGDEPTHDLWHESTFPPFAASHFAFEGGEETGTGLLDARLDRGGVVRGRAWGQGITAGSWRYRIECGAASVDQGPTELTDEGTFHFSTRWLPSHQYVASAQLSLLREGAEARGWLAIEALLELDTASRRALGAIDRILLGLDRLADVRTLFESVIADLENDDSSTHELRPRQATRPGEGHEQQRRPERSLDTRLLWEQGPSLPGNISLNADRTTQSFLEAVLARIVGSNARPAGEEEGNNGDDPDDGDRDRNGEKEKSRAEGVSEALARFNTRFEGAWKEPGRIPLRKRAHALVAQGLVNLFVLQSWPELVDRPRFFLERWLRRAVSEFANSPTDASLRSLLAGSIAILSTPLVDNERATGGQRMEAGELRQLTERFFGSVTPEMLIELGGAWLSTPMAQSLGAEKVNLLGLLKSLLETPTASSRLREILELHRDGQTSGRAVINAIETVNAVMTLSSDERKVLTDILRSSPQRPNYTVLKQPLPKGCPRCYCRLDEDVVRTLGRRRIARCLSCSTPLVFLS